MEHDQPPTRIIRQAGGWKERWPCCELARLRHDKGNSMQHPSSILVLDNERCCAARAWAKLHERNEIGMLPEQESLPSSNAAAPEPSMLPVLIVDDEPNILEMLRDVLQEAGFVVLTAHDGKAALALLAQMPVALVLTDLMMPHVTGLQLAQQMRSNPRTAAIPVLVMSAALPPHLDDVFAAILPKPFALDDLVTIVRQFGVDHTRGFQQSDRE